MTSLSSLSLTEAIFQGPSLVLHYLPDVPGRPGGPGRSVMDRCIRRGASARAREVSAKWLRVVRLRVLRPRDFRMARALRI